MIAFKSVVEDMVRAFPELETFSAEERDDTLKEFPELAYVIFGDLFKPFIERAMNSNDVEMLRRICSFLEEASCDAGQDPMLANLIGVEIGEWLQFVQGEDRIGPWLGEQTRKVTGYVPGRATELRKSKGLPC